MLTESTATELLDKLESGEVSSRELTDACLERIERLDERLGAFLDVHADSARQQAEAVDRRRGSGEAVGPLGGLPVAVKDVLCQVDVPTTCGSQYLAEFRSPYDATVVQRLRDAGAVLIGKTNMDEFAMGSSGENSSFRPTANPWRLSHVPGGSSSGSAACVAADLAPLAIGTDTGGSIRQPAAFCGVSGLKPTYGRVSRYGLVAFASSLDQAGPMGRSAEDLAVLLEAIAGHDPLDSTSAPQAAGGYREACRRPLAGVRLGRVSEHFEQGGDTEVLELVQQAIDTLQRLGAEVVDVHLPHSKYAIATYYVIAPSEASSNLSRYDGMRYGRRADEASVRESIKRQRADGQEPESALVETYNLSRSEGLGPEVQRRVMLGAYALSAGYYDQYYVKALKVRRLIRQDYDAAFQKVDVLVGPVTPTPAYALGEKTSDPLSMYLGDLFTVGANLAGVPALSAPCGVTGDGLPVGLHLQGPLFGEQRLLQVAAAWQRETDWHLRRPTLD